MAQVITFEGYRPAPRYDEIPFTTATLEEGATVTGSWTVIDTFTLDTVDADPSQPQARDFTTELASDTPDLWYRITFADATGDTSQPTYPVQNSTAVQAPYASADELAALLKVSLSGRREQLQRVLEAAAAEIDFELGRTDRFGVPPALVIEVNLERAVEHWQQMQSPFGIIGLGGIEGMERIHTARDSWDRHAHKLAPLKATWGFA